VEGQGRAVWGGAKGKRRRKKQTKRRRLAFKDGHPRVSSLCARLLVPTVSHIPPRQQGWRALCSPTRGRPPARVPGKKIKER